MKKSVNVHIYWNATGYGEKGGNFVFIDSDVLKDTESYSLLGSKEVEFDIGEFDEREFLIDSLTKKKESICQKAAQEVVIIEDKLQQLLALPSA